MTKLKKVFLGFLSLWPLMYFLLFFLFFLTVFIGAFSGTLSDKTIFPLFFVMFFLHLTTIFLIFGLLIYYIVHLFKNDRISNDLKALWAVVLFFGNVIAMPVYWFFYIWKEPNSEINLNDTKNQA